MENLWWNESLGESKAHSARTSSVHIIGNKRTPEGELVMIRRF